MEERVRFRSVSDVAMVLKRFKRYELFDLWRSLHDLLTTYSNKAVIANEVSEEILGIWEEHLLVRYPRRELRMGDWRLRPYLEYEGRLTMIIMSSIQGSVVSKGDATLIKRRVAAGMRSKCLLKKRSHFELVRNISYGFS